MAGAQKLERCGLSVPSSFQPPSTWYDEDPVPMTRFSGSGYRSSECMYGVTEFESSADRRAVRHEGSALTARRTARMAARTPLWTAREGKAIFEGVK